jgi:GNAT superfamily N-acetyltransferase
LDANTRFVYRASVLNELKLLTGAEPKEQDGLAFAAGGDGVGVLAVLDEAASLEKLLAFVRSLIGAGGQFPRVIVPAPPSEEIHEYFYVYDFSETACEVSVLAKATKVKSTTGVTVEPALGLPDELAFGLAESMGCGAEDAKRLLASGSDALITFQATKDGEAVGAAAVFCADVECRLAGLFTLPSARGQGVGRALLSHFLDTAQARGSLLVTSVYPAETDFKFYLAKHGFSDLLQWRRYTPPEPGFREGL